MCSERLTEFDQPRPCLPQLAPKPVVIRGADWFRQMAFLDGTPMQGVFRLSPQIRPERASGKVLIGVVEDSTGAIDVQVREDLIENVLAGSFPVVSVAGLVAEVKGRIGLVLTSVTLNPVTIDPVRLIPRSICPVPELLDRLEKAVRQFQTEPLCRFMQRVLSDDRLMFPFVSLPASRVHHHSEPGGLLMHSLECLECVAQMTMFERAELELGMAAALLHDISKVMTMKKDGTKTRLGAVMEHDELTLRVLAAHLDYLDHLWLNGSIALQHLLKWKSGKGRPLPLMTIAEAVNSADRISAGQDLSRRAFHLVPNSHFITKVQPGRIAYRPVFRGQ